METAALYTLFLQCMAAFLHGEKASLPDTLTPQEWGKLYALAKRQNLSGALYTVTDGTPMPDVVRDRLRRDGFLMIAAYEAQQAMCAQMAEGFSAKEIPHLFFKGAVVRRYYPDPAMRSMGDVDMVVKRSDMKRAHGVMTALGFERTTVGTEVWVYERNRYSVEMHCALRQFHVEKQEGVDYDELWTDARLQKGTTYRWSYEAEAAFTVSHLIAHFCSGGCGLRQLMDVAVLYQSRPDEALWQGVCRRLKAYGTDIFFMHLLYLCKMWLGVETAPSLTRPLAEDTTRLICCRLLNEGVFGTDARTMLAIERKERQLQKQGGRLGHVWRWLFPPAEYLQKRYAYARNPLLLPAAYVQRTWEGVTKNRHVHQNRWRYSREQQDTLEAEVAFFKEIGL